MERLTQLGSTILEQPWTHTIWAIIVFLTPISPLSVTDEHEGTGVRGEVATILEMKGEGGACAGADGVTVKEKQWE